MNIDNGYLYSDDDDVTESTEKMVSSQSEGKFEIILDVIKINTNLDLED